VKTTREGKSEWWVGMTGVCTLCGWRGELEAGDTPLAVECCSYSTSCVNKRCKSCNVGEVVFSHGKK
jgi:hypothetical protein